jgi:hypothetical protein
VLSPVWLQYRASPGWTARGGCPHMRCCRTPHIYESTGEKSGKGCCSEEKVCIVPE